MSFAKEIRWCARIFTPIALVVAVSACQTQVVRSGANDELPDQMIATGYEYEADNATCRAMLQELRIKFRLAKADSSHVPAFREAAAEIYQVCGIEVF